MFDMEDDEEGHSPTSGDVGGRRYRKSGDVGRGSLEQA
jgi:hypothetical protein